MKNGAVYIRVSTEEQTEYSPDAQLKDIKKYAKANNILITKEFTFIEPGITGRSVEKREQFKKMIALAKKKPKPFEVVLIHAYDRFARNVKESRIYKELLRKDLGIELISVTEQFGTDKNSFLMEGIKDVLNEYYSLNLSDEVLKGMKEKASRGELQCSASFGYKVVNNVLEIVEEEANIVRLIYDKYANSNLNYMDITKLINRLGVNTKRGNKWETRTIKYVLHNPVYIGKLRWSTNGRVDYHMFNSNDKTTITDSKHKPIIDLNTWNKVQEKAQINNKFSKQHQAASTECWHWIKGLIKCPFCNHTYTKLNKSSIRCNGYNKGICDNNVSFKVSDIEELILEQIKEDFKSKVQINVNIRKTSENIEKSLLIKKLENLQIKKERIKESYISGIDTLEEYKSNKELILNEENKLKQELEKYKDDNLDDIQKQIKINAKSIYEMLKDEKIGMDLKRNAINKLIDKVEINPKTKEISIYYNN